jgi:hypothetical protein
VIPDNASIVEVQRALSRGAHGLPAKTESFYHGVRCRIDTRKSTRQLPDGNFAQLDGELLIEAPYELNAGDIVRVQLDVDMMIHERSTEMITTFRVVGCDCALDIFGQLSYTNYFLAFNPLAQDMDR